MRVAVIQLNASRDLVTNVNNAMRLVDDAAKQGAQFVLLPEYSTFVGAYEAYPENAEQIPGPTTDLMCAKAKHYGIYLHGGSMIEARSDANRFYNTSVLCGPNGKIVAVYRKIHLFDIDVPDEVTDIESSVVLPGDQLVLANILDCCLGFTICFDLRFPEIYRALSVAGADVLVVPAAFAEATGKVHWETLLRARAIENHAFVLAADQCGKDETGHKLYGHSMIIDPWGKVITKAPSEEESILIADIDIDQVKLRRNQIQVFKIRVPEIYNKKFEIKR